MEEVKFECPECKKGFVNKIALVGHMNCAHKKIAQFKKQHKEEPQTGNGIKVLPVKAEDYIPKTVPKYIPQGRELQLYEAHLENGIPILIVGPKGVGKTLGLAAFAYEKKIPIIQFDCSENTKRYDLIGRFILKGESVEYLLGALPTAIEVANQHKSAILVLEELNALSPQMQKVLNQLLDWRRHVYIPELSKTYRLNNGIKLLIAATMNPSTYGGVFELNEDLKSRFAEYFIGYPETDTEKKILSVNELDEELVKKLTLLAYETRKSTELSYALSPRDLALFTQLYISYKRLFTEAEALKYALKVTMVNRYQDVQERRTIEERIKSIFGEVL